MTIRKSTSTVMTIRKAQNNTVNTYMRIEEEEEGKETKNEEEEEEEGGRQGEEGD